MSWRAPHDEVDVVVVGSGVGGLSVTLLATTIAEPRPLLALLIRLGAVAAM